MTTRLAPAPLPAVFQYADACQYLNAIYLARKQSEPRFSYTTWAAEIGFQSRTFLKLIIAGKRSITERSLPLIIDNLKLTPAETTYFVTLVRLARSSTVAERNTHLNALCEQRKPSQRTNSSKVLDHYQFLSSPLGPRIQSLLTIDRTTPWHAQEFADLLNVRVSSVQTILKTLVHLGLAKPSGDGYVTCTPDFEVEDSLGNEALQNFHRESLKDAIRALETPVSDRRYQTMFVALTPEALKTLNQKMQHFIAETLEQFTGNEFKAGARLYQVNFNAFPISTPLIQSDQVCSAPAGKTKTAEGAAPYPQHKEIEA